MTTQDLLNRQYGVNTLDRDDPLGITAITMTPQRILDNDPGAVQVTIINLGSNDMYLWTDPSVSSTHGILIAANGGSYEIDFTRFATLPTREWWCVSKTSTTNITCKRLSII